MSGATLTRQLILDANGEPIGIILPIEEYQELTRGRRAETIEGSQSAPQSLFGVLRHLGGRVADTESLDEARRALWKSWDKCKRPQGAMLRCTIW